MATQLHKISWPELTSSNFGVGLREAFENIDSNFQKLASLGLTAGAPGIPAIWIPYNLNSVFCHISGDVFQSNYLNSEHIGAIQESYNKYNAITGLSKITYIEECKRLYRQLVRDLPDNKDSNDQPIDVTSGSDESSKTWRHKWEILPNSSTFIFDDLTDNDWLLKSYIGYTNNGTYNPGQYLDFIPGDILVAGNWDEESKIFSKLSTTAHIYIDPRFRNPMTIAGKVNTEQLARATDQSCVVYGSKDGDEFKFEYVYAFPRVHCKDGEFYLSVNGIDTNIPLTGRQGVAGKNTQFVAVQMADDTDINDINNIVYGTTDNTAPNTIFEVTKRIGSEEDLSPEASQLLDGCPAFIFPPASYTANAYVTLYWVGYLKWDGNVLTAYCGRENLILVDLYEHSFGGMMMGLDMYERSKARPAGNAPWYKPRGLMLPIGARYIGSDRNEYWNPTYDGETNSGYDPVDNFGAHLIYSKKSNGNLKTELHVGSIDDYRRIGTPNDIAEGIDYTSDVIENKVDGIRLFIDEPVTITNYDTIPPTSLLDVKGNATIDGTTTSGKFVRESHKNDKRLLMSNGWSTSTQPIAIEQGNSDTPSVNWIDGVDGEARIKITLPKVELPEIPELSLIKNSTTIAYNNDIYTFQLTTLVHGREKRLAILHVDLSLGGEQGVCNNDAYDNGPHEIANLSNLLADVKPPYKMWQFIGSTNKRDDIGNDDAQMGIWFSLSLDKMENKIKFCCERCDHPHYLGGKNFSMDFIYPLSGTVYTYYWALNQMPEANDTLSGATTTIPGAPAGSTEWYLVIASKECQPDEDHAAPTSYGESTWTWSYEKQTEQHTYYWASQSKPEINTTAGNPPGPTETNANLWNGNVDKNKIWYLISVKSTKNDLANNSGYNYSYGVANSSAGIDTNDWNCTIQTPSNITYQWCPDSDANYNIINYLMQTLLAYKDDSVGKLKGSLIDVLRNNLATYRRFDGAFGTVHVERNSTPIANGSQIGLLAVSAWVSSQDSLNDGIRNESVKIKAAVGSPENINYSNGEIVITFNQS